MKKPAAIVTDIEGTTSSIDFVHKVLFPYARRALPDYVREHQCQPGVAPLIQEVREASGDRAAGIDEVIATLSRWIDEDRKATSLKALQGLVWERGYLRGDFTGHIYDDAVRKLREWHDEGIRLYVYSSGSVKAQQQLFGHSDAGDLRPLFSGYFDTRTGHKREPAAYKAIVEDIGLPAADILFLSDVIDELDAASAAGLRTILVLRKAGKQCGRHPSVHDFDEIIF